jgi:hypothetical protein
MELVFKSPVFKKEKTSLGKLTWNEILLAVEYVERPDVIRRIVLGEHKGWHQIFKSAGVKHDPPSWLKKWSNYWGITPLFTILEGDCIEGVGFILSDSSCGEFWFGMGGSPADEMMGWKLRKVSAPSGILTPENVFKVVSSQFVISSPADEDDRAAILTEFESILIYNKQLLPRTLMEEYIRSNRSLFPSGKNGDLALSKWLSSQYTQDSQ